MHSFNCPFISNSLGQPPEKRSKEKDTKKKKQVQIDSTVEVQTEIECRAPEQLPEKEATKDVNEGESFFLNTGLYIYN